jgi:hypothetical protein
MPVGETYTVFPFGADFFALPVFFDLLQLL